MNGNRYSDSWYGSGSGRSYSSNDWRNGYREKCLWWIQGKKRTIRVRTRCDTKNLWTRSECKLFDASWDWNAELDKDSTREYPGGSNASVKRKAENEEESMALDPKQVTELDRKTQFPERLQKPGVTRSTEHFNMSDELSSSGASPERAAGKRSQIRDPKKKTGRARRKEHAGEK